MENLDMLEYNFKEVEEFVPLTVQADVKYPPVNGDNTKYNELKTFFTEQGTVEPNMVEPCGCSGCEKP